MIKKYGITLLAFAVVATTASTVFAKPNITVTTVTPSGHSVAIAARAIEVAPHVFDLGNAIDPDSGKSVQGYAIVRYKKDGGNAKGGKKGGQGGGTSGTSSCYTFLASGAKWKNSEPWMINPSNNEGLNDQYIFDTLSSAISTWEDAADGSLDNTGLNILGNGILTHTYLSPDSVSPNGNNEVVFGSVDDTGAIAVTIVWGIFGGRPQNREIVEWDQIYDQTDFDWSDTDDPAKMNFGNIASHELGHSFGLGDLYQPECASETMYGYGIEGETQKITLESGDIAGISKLY